MTAPASRRGAGRQRVLVTGASRGLGRELALEFARRGSNLVVHGRDEEALEHAARGVRELGARCDVVQGDLSAPATLDRLEDAVREGLDILINNAGVYLNQQVADLDPQSLRDVIETNLFAPILLTRRLFPTLRDRGGGLVVFINSLAGLQGSDGEAAYCASKHGLRGFSRSFRFEALRHQVLVLDVYLGAMNTAMVHDRKAPEKCISPQDAASFIVGACADYPSMRVDEVHLARRNY